MKPDEVKHLLGGYATGTLTSEEQQLLFAAALEDQELFDALMREQALKETLEFPGARRELIEVLESKPPGRSRRGAWLRWPYPVAAAGALAAAAVMVVVLTRPAPKPAEVAALRPPAEPARVAETQPRARKQQRKEEVRANLAPQPVPQQLPSMAAPLSVAPMAVPSLPPTPKAVPLPAPVGAAIAMLERPQADAVRSNFASSEPEASTKARDLFYGKADHPAAAGALISGTAGSSRGVTMLGARARVAAAPASTVGLRYWSETGPDGNAQLKVEANVDATLYAFRREATAEWTAITVGGLSLQAHRLATVAVGAIDFSAPGPHLIAIVSRGTLTELAQSGVELTRAVENLRVAGELAPPVVDSSGGATFAISRTSRPLVVPVNIP